MLRKSWLSWKYLKKTRWLERAHLTEPSKKLANQPVSAVAIAVGAQSPPSQVKPALTLLQANLLVATLAGFWARKADGHPGPDLMGRGLLILNALVQWERIKKARPKHPPARQAARKPISLASPNSNHDRLTTSNK